MKETFKFYPRGLAGGRSFYTRPPCEFKGCGKPSDFIAEGDKGSVFYSCAYYLGATIIVGVLVFGVLAAWYAALVKLYQALKDTYYMTLYVRFMRISKNRERLRKAWREADRLWSGQHNN